MKLLEQLREIHSRLIPPFDVIARLTTNGDWVEGVLARNIPNWGGSGVYRMPLDSKYHIPSLEDMQKIIEWSWVDQKPYLKAFYDCENYAFSFKALTDRIFKVNSVGILIDWSGEHAYNIFLTPEGDVFLLEPQDDRYWNISDHDFSGQYALKQAVILI